MCKNEIILSLNNRSAKRWEHRSWQNTYYSAQCTTPCNSFTNSKVFKWKIKTDTSGDEDAQYFIGLAKRQPNFYEKIVFEKDSYFLDILHGDTLCNGVTEELYGFKEIVNQTWVTARHL